MVEESLKSNAQSNIPEPTNEDDYRYSKIFGLIIVFEKYANYREQNRT